jgi:hypothetical protein
VLEQRLRRAVWDGQATAATALRAVEDSTLYLRSRRLADELGSRSVELLAAERTVDDAPQVLRRIRRLLAFYRTTEPALPAWCEQFVKTGFAHYCTLLPLAFTDEEIGVRQVAAMLGFLSSMEGLALSLGCDRAQLELAVKQSHPEAPAKVALLWAAKLRLGKLTLDDLRARCDELLANPLVVPKFPLYLSGFVQALEPVPSLAPFVVEVLSKAFARLPDPVLLPWLPTLITTLKEQAAELVPVLVREAGRTFPGALSAVDSWAPPWSSRAAVAASVPAAATVNTPVAGLLEAYPGATDALAAVLGCQAGWVSTVDGMPAAGGVSAVDSRPEVRALLERYPSSAQAILQAIS